MRSIHRILSGIMCAVLVFCVVFAAAPEARAITTVFMVPPISPTYVHHNTPEPELDEPLYALPLKSPNYTAIIIAAAAAVAVIAAAAVIIVKKKKK